MSTDPAFKEQTNGKRAKPSNKNLHRTTRILKGIMLYPKVGHHCFATLPRGTLLRVKENFKRKRWEVVVMQGQLKGYMFEQSMNKEKFF